MLLPTIRNTLRGILLVLGSVFCTSALAFPPAPTFDLDWTTQANGYRIQAVRQPASPNYFPPLLALRAAAILDATRLPLPGDPGSIHQAHWLQGFDAPWFMGGDRLVQFYDCYRPGTPNDGCGGGFALPERIVLPAPEYRTIPESCTRMVLAHELFHQIQFGHAERAGVQGCGWIGATACEGMARAMQDKLYLDLDRDPDASCFSGYHEEVGGYLDDPNRNLWDSGYASALWWNYLSEQYGHEQLEPQRGVDFFVRWLDLAEAGGAHVDPLAITRQAIRQSAAELTVQGVFQNFLLANRIKGLNLVGAPEAFRLRFSYRDEELQPGLPAPTPYPLPQRATRVVAPDEPAEFAFDARAFGAQYVDWDISRCPSGSLLRWETQPDAQGEAVPSYTLTSLVAVRGTSPGRPLRLYKNRSRGWSKDLLQPAPGFDRLLSVVAGWSARTGGELRLSCTPQAAEPALPFASPLRPFTPGPPERLAVVEVPVALDPPPAPDASGRATLSIDDFALQVGERPAEVLSAIAEGEGYRLQVAMPTQDAAGSYPLRLSIGEMHTQLEDAVRYAAPSLQLLVALDTSASMQRSGDDALAAMQATLPILIDALPDSARLGLLDHGEGVAPQATQRAPLAPLLDAQRRQLALALSALSTRRGNGAAVGDALQQAVASFAQDDSDTPARHVLLIVDGSQGPGAGWPDVRDAVLAAGIAVHTVAVGPRADQPMLARIAAESGGSYHFVERGQGVDSAELADTLLGVVERLDRRLRLARESQLSAVPGQTVSRSVEVPSLLDPPADARLHFALFAGDARQASAPTVVLRDPDGQVRNAASPATRLVQHANRWQLSTPYLGGRWTLEVSASSASPTQPLGFVASLFDGGQGSLSMLFDRAADGGAINSFGIGDHGGIAIGLLLPAVQQVRLAGSSTQRTPVQTARAKGLLLPAVQSVREAAATVRHPDGHEDRLSLQPAAGNGSGQFEDSIWVADYRRLTRGAPSGLVEDPDSAGQSGSYRIDATFRFPQPGGASWTLLGRRDVVVRAEPTAEDSDGDSLPNRYEDALPCLDSGQADARFDPDSDGLSNREEYVLGTHPCLADTDGGGESDGSELRAGRDPQWNTDDTLCPLELAQVERPGAGDSAFVPADAQGITLRFSSCPQNTRIEVRRGSAGADELLPIAQIDALQHRGRWLDRDVLPGQRYRYQLVASSAVAVGPPSAPFEAIAARQPEGRLQINQGRPRSDDPLLHLELRSSVGPEAGTSLRLAIDDGEFGPWQPFSRSLLLAVAAPGAPRRVRVTAQLRSADGLSSPPFSDSTVLHPPASLAAIRTRMTRAGGTPAHGALLWLPDSATETQSVADAQGLASLQDLLPGRYRVQLAVDEQVQRTQWVQLAPGQTLDLGEQVLDPGQLDFADGFE